MTNCDIATVEYPIRPIQCSTISAPSCLACHNYLIYTSIRMRTHLYQQCTSHSIALPYRPHPSFTHPSHRRFETPRNTMYRIVLFLRFYIWTHRAGVRNGLTVYPRAQSQCLSDSYPWLTSITDIKIMQSDSTQTIFWKGQIGALVIATGHALAV